MMTSIPVDPALPRLREALDESAMAEAFGDAIATRGLRVERCRIDRVKYRPGRNCSVSYRLGLHDVVRGVGFEQRVAARLCRPDDSRRRYEHAAADPWSPTPAGPGLRELPQLDMVTWWWPNDPKLAAPRLLACGSLLRAQLLPDLLAALGVPRGLEPDIRVGVAQYVPEQRLTARVDLHWQEQGRRQHRCCYAKSSREPDSEAVHRMLRELHRSPAVQAGRLRVPAPLLYQPGWQLHWQSAMPGCALLDLPKDMADALSPALGAQLAELHAIPVPTGRVIDLAQLAARLDEVTGVLQRALPDVQVPLALAARRLADRLPALAASTAATLHGDLHPRNVLVDTTGAPALSLIDLDGLRRGPAVLELGAWFADGLYRAALDGRLPMEAAAGWRGLLDAYVDAGGERPDPALLAAATAWNLLTQRAWRCVVNLKPGRFGIAPDLVRLAAGLAATDRLEFL